MRLTGLFAGREAMISEGAALATVSDNIANLNTTGFKSGRTEFSNLLAASEGNLFGSTIDPGNGAQVQDVKIRFDKQGTFDFTDRSLDVAIDGKGFFTVTDGTDQFYTRAGNFNVDDAGNLLTADDKSVMGFTTASPETAVPLTVTGVTGTATPSATASIAGNINGTSPVVTLPAGTSFAELGAAAEFVSSVTLVDSLGETHDVSLYFFHSTAPLGFTVNAYVDSAETTGVAGTPVQVGTTNLTFGATGLQAEGAGATLNIAAPWGNGATASAVAVDLSGMTGFSSPSTLSQVVVDGNRAGTPTGYEILEDGSFNVTLDNGDSITVGTIVLSNFQSEQGLERVGDNLYREGDTAGDPVTGAPGSQSRGELVGGALEGSNVDPASEFIDLVRYQRAYQAGSQIITTYSELIATTLQLA